MSVIYQSEALKASAKKVVEIGDALLILGDSLKIMPTLGKVDAVVTDPFYGIAGGSGGDAKAYAKGDYSDLFEDTPESVELVCVPAIKWAIKNANAVALTPGIRCLHLYPPAKDMGCFWTPAAITHGPWGFTTFQPILYYGKDYRAGKGALPTGIQVTERSEKNGHPCPKPIIAWTWLVAKVSQAEETVFDPFMGSGTTGVACMNLGRKFTGIEIEERYFNIAVKRIREAYNKISLFPPSSVVSGPRRTLDLPLSPLSSDMSDKES